MKHEEFEKQMFSHVNHNCQMKELDRQEIERAAMEEYQFRCKCKKVNAIIGIVMWLACYTTIIFAMGVLSRLGDIRPEIAVAVTAAVSFIAGFNVNALANRIKF